MWGLGDSIYSRPFIAAAASAHDVWLETPWPELYADLPLRFVRGDRPLRTQTRNVLRQRPALWTTPPHRIAELRLSYGAAELARGSIIDAIEARLPASRPKWSLPALGESPLDTDGTPMAVIRPVTRRAEWDNEARNCLPAYVDEIAGTLKQAGFAVAVIADLKPGAEWLESGNLPPHNAAFTNGEFSVRQLLAIVRDAAVVVGPVGWIVPAAVALGTPAFVILGGQGAHNGPDKITDPRMDLSRLGFAVPQEFCQCSEMRHRCDKRIPDLMTQWARWRSAVTLQAPRC
jgi:hypothetical protein